MDPARVAEMNVFNAIAEKRAVCETASGVGPAAALKRMHLEDRTPGERFAWIEMARLDAILGGMRLSLPCLRTGLRCILHLLVRRTVVDRTSIRSASFIFARRSMFP